MIYDVRTLTKHECEDAIAGYELEKDIRKDCPPVVDDLEDAILSLKARLAELNGRKVEWVSA